MTPASGGLSACDSVARILGPDPADDDRVDEAVWRHLAECPRCRGRWPEVEALGAASVVTGATGRSRRAAGLADAPTLPPAPLPPPPFVPPVGRPSASPNDARIDRPSSRGLPIGDPPSGGPRGPVVLTAGRGSRAVARAARIAAAAAVVALAVGLARLAPVSPSSTPLPAPIAEAPAPLSLTTRSVTAWERVAWVDGQRVAARTRFSIERPRPPSRGARRD